MSAGAVTCRFTPSLMTSTRQAAPRKVTPLMRPCEAVARRLRAALGAAADQLDAFRPDRDRHRRRIVDALRHSALDLPAAQDLDLAAAVGGADQAARQQVGGADEAGDERIGRPEIDVVRRADLA